jgi:hypothetical protein
VQVIAFPGFQMRKKMAVIGLLATLIWLSISPARVIAFTEPGITGTWGDFANCPVTVIASLPNNQCEHSYTTGGVVQIGHSSVPISIPGDTLDVGVTIPEGQGITMAPPRGILNGPAQPVPGGVLGAIGNVQLTGVTAKLEWATPLPPNTIFGFTEKCGASPSVTFDICKILNARAGTAVTLSAKIHLMSPFLGSSCFIGSAAHPIVIALTTGVTSPPPPAKPIHGSSLEFLVSITPFYLQAVGFTFVSNAFSVPTASGCGTTGGSLVDASINHKLGLPSPAGQNMIAISAIAEQAQASVVLEHGWTGQ